MTIIQFLAALPVLVSVAAGASAAAQTLAGTVIALGGGPGTVRALDAGGSVVIAGLPQAPAQASSETSAPTGSRKFYIDSRSGNDHNNGLSADRPRAGKGPWRTLARLMKSDLSPGDVVVLACRSQWAETLRLPSSGTVARPILVKAATGCTERPTIDGSAALKPDRWAKYQGNIYKAALDKPPLQLFAAQGLWLEAHHPNRGYLAADPKSLYLPMAANGDVVAINGRQTSSNIVVMDDLGLPANTRLSPGTRIRIRTASWSIDESEIEGVEGNRIKLVQPTAFPAQTGWGYYLLGQLWMVDSPGEWYYDAQAQQLFAWMPAGAAMAVQATLLAEGINLRGREHVVIDGLAVRKVGTGINLRRAKGIRVINNTFEDIAGRGADAAASADITLASNIFARTALEAITGIVDTDSIATRMTVVNNRVQDSGVLMHGNEESSLPRRTHAAICGVPSSLIAGNVIVNAGYNGIRAMVGSVIENNFVTGACSVLDDCAGIYNSETPNNTVIRGNTVLHVQGALRGKPPNSHYTQAQGIYLDESASGVLVEDNTVVDADNGIQLHVAARNTISKNRLYGNRRSQIWLQETRKRDNPNGDVFDNLIVDNLIAPIHSTAVGLLLQTNYASIAAFGMIDRNRYLDSATPVIVHTSTGNTRRQYTLAQWQAATNAPAGHDSQGSAISGTAPSAKADVGANLSSVLINGTAEPIATHCPFEGSAPAACNAAFRLDNNMAVTWPLNLPARSAVIVYTR